MPCPGVSELGRAIFRVTGNITGIAEAGAVWAKLLRTWLTTTMRFTQNIADPCVFSRPASDPGGTMLLGTHVDGG